MDNVTHALAGLVLADATVALMERRIGTPVAPAVRRTAVLLGIAAAELPDGDLLYSGGVLGMGKLGYLLHHRGHTHTVLVAVALGVLLWGAILWAQRSARVPSVRWPLLGLALAGVLSHLLLDFTNSYGVHPFWPVFNGWVYGDAVFIVEPWIWVAAIPALVFGARSRIGRALLVLALAVIVGAALFTDAVDRSAALVLLAGAVVSVAATWRARVTSRLVFAVSAWLMVEAVGLAASSAARAQVVLQIAPAGSAEAALGTLRDVVLTPAPANPLCFDALIVEEDSAEYRASRATVAPWPALRSAASCVGSGEAVSAAREPGPGLAGGMRPSTRADAAAIVWRQEWAAPAGALATLARNNCSVAAALRFIRVPVWEVLPDGRVALSDLRYGNGGNGFADVELPGSSNACPAYVPSWTPPRAELLRAGVSDGATGG